MAGQAVRQTGPGSGMAADWAERLFHLSRWRTNVGTELLAGLTTFMVMAYIIFVNPTVLTATSSPSLRPGITTATCLVAGLLCLFMGLYTNRAYALAHPGRYAATVWAPAPGDEEHAAVGAAAIAVLATVLKGYRIEGEDVIDAIRMLRAALHGFVSMETAGGFGLPQSVDVSFTRLVEALDTAWTTWVPA